MLKLCDLYRIWLVFQGTSLMLILGLALLYLDQEPPSHFHRGLQIIDSVPWLSLHSVFVWAGWTDNGGEYLMKLNLKILKLHVVQYLRSSSNLWVYNVSMWHNVSFGYFMGKIEKMEEVGWLVGNSIGIIQIQVVFSIGRMLPVGVWYSVEGSVLTHLLIRRVLIRRKSRKLLVQAKERGVHEQLVLFMVLGEEEVSEVEHWRVRQCWNQTQGEIVVGLISFAKDFMFLIKLVFSGWDRWISWDEASSKSFWFCGLYGISCSHSK